MEIIINYMLEFLSSMRFYGIDSLIDFLIVFVSALICYRSHKIFKLIGDKKYKFFSWAFLSIFLGFLFKIISNLTFLYRVF